MRGLAGGGPRWSPGGWQEGCAGVWGTFRKSWGGPVCKEFDPIGHAAQGLPADERVSEGDHRLGLASRHRSAEHGFTTRAAVRKEVKEDLRDGEPTWMGKMT